MIDSKENNPFSVKASGNAKFIQLISDYLKKKIIQLYPIYVLDKYMNFKRQLNVISTDNLLQITHE